MHVIPSFPAASSVLQGALRSPAAPAAKPGLIVAGATGALGAEVLRRLVGSGRFLHADVMAREPMTAGLAGVRIVPAAKGPISGWPPRPGAQVAVVMFEPPRLYYDRERALWTPAPEQLPELACWLRRCGVQTLVIVMPHAQGRLPAALQRGLATLDEQLVAAGGFERVLFVRSARKEALLRPAGFFRRTAAWMLSTLSYMVPATEQPVRPAKIAEFIDAALQLLPPGTHVASPELLWQAAQGGGKRPHGAGVHSVVQAWLNGTQASRPP